MDEAFGRVLARYEQRAAEEAELWRTTPPGELFGRRDEMLLHVGADLFGEPRTWHGRTLPTASSHTPSPPSATSGSAAATKGLS